MLRAIAWYWDHDIFASKTREIAEALAAAMLQPGAVLRMWQDLPEPARSALSALVASGGRMPLDLFFRRFGMLAPVGPGRLEREERWRSPANIAERLWYRGLIGRAFDSTRSGPEEFVFIPRDLLAMLPQAEQHAPDAPGGIAAVPDRPRGARPNLVDDVTTLLAYLQTSVTPAGANSALLYDRLAPYLLDPDAQRLAFAWQAMLAAGLAAARPVENGASRLRPDAARARPWMDAGREAELRALADGWRNDAAWNDLRHVPTLECEDTGWRNDPLRARAAILKHLAAVPAGTWWSLDAFVQAVKLRDPDFQRDEYESWYVRVRDPQNPQAPGTYLRSFEDWERVEGALIAYVITGPLHWLGLVDLAEGAFLLNARGAAFVRGEPALEEDAEPSAPDETGAMRVRADASVEVPLAARRYNRFQIARVADWLHPGDPYVYRLSPASLERARTQGITVTRLLDFFARECPAAVPVSVREALRRWDEAGVELTLADAVVLRVETPGLLEQLLNAPRTAGFIQQALGPHAALVKRSDAERLAAAIRELGYLVRRE